MKKFITGFTGILSSAILASTVAFAAWTAEPATFKVLVDGKEFTSGNAVVIDGSTYLPLRAIGDALGVNVNWNEELGQVEVGNCASTEAAGTYSMQNPAPINTVQTYTKTMEYYKEGNYSAAIRVMETIRGNEAWQMIKEDNMFNDEPKDGYEYIIVKVAFSLLSKETEGSVSADKYDFDFYSSNNEEYESVFVVKEGSLDTNLFPGGNCEGYIVGMVKKDDVAPKLAYGLEYNGTGGIWFAL